MGLVLIDLLLHNPNKSRRARLLVRGMSLFALEARPWKVLYNGIRSRDFDHILGSLRMDHILSTLLYIGGSTTLLLKIVNIRCFIGLD